jgi:hypothetical protein
MRTPACSRAPVNAWLVNQLPWIGVEDLRLQRRTNLSSCCLRHRLLRLATEQPLHQSSARFLPNHGPKNWGHFDSPQSTTARTIISRPSGVPQVREPLSCPDGSAATTGIGLMPVLAPSRPSVRAAVTVDGVPRPPERVLDFCDLKRRGEPRLPCRAGLLARLIAPWRSLDNITI